MGPRPVVTKLGDGKDDRLVGDEAPCLGPIGAKLACACMSCEGCSGVDPTLHTVVQPCHTGRGVLQDDEPIGTCNCGQQMASAIMNRSRFLYCKLLLNRIVRKTIQVLRSTDRSGAGASKGGPTVFAAVGSCQCGTHQPTLTQAKQ